MVSAYTRHISPTLTFLSRSSFFLIGFYTLSLVCFSLIVKFGILRSINPPSPTLRGMFVLSSFVAGVAGGGFTIFFWQATKYLIGAWGGLAFGLWVQCFRDGGLIRPVGIRWLLFISMWALFSLVSVSVSCIVQLAPSSVSFSVRFPRFIIKFSWLQLPSLVQLQSFWVWTVFPLRDLKKSDLLFLPSGSCKC